MKVYKNGIYRSINPNQAKKYTEMGYRLKGCLEPQPEQLDLYVVDDYTIAKKEKIE